VGALFISKNFVKQCWFCLKVTVICDAASQVLKMFHPVIKIVKMNKPNLNSQGGAILIGKKLWNGT